MNRFLFTIEMMIAFFIVSATVIAQNQVRNPNVEPVYAVGLVCSRYNSPTEFNSPTLNRNNTIRLSGVASVQPSPTETLSVSFTSVCGSTTMTLSAMPAGANYTWIAPAGASIVSGANDQNAIVRGAGVYTLTIKHPTVCMTQTMTTILAEPVTSMPPPTITLTGHISCTTPTQTLSANATAEVTYSWSGPGIVSDNRASSIVINAGGSYVVTATNGTCSSSATTNVQQTSGQPPTVSLTAATTTISCASPSTQLTAVIHPASASYTWAIPAGCALSNTSLTHPIASGSGVYTLTATNPANGCTSSATTRVTMGLSTVTLSATSSSVCSGGSTTLMVRGNATSYTWAPPASLNVSTGPVVIANPGSTTNYTITGADGACTQTVGVSVVVIPAPAIAVSAFPASVCPGGLSTLRATGAASYTWSSGNTGGDIASVRPMATTIYTVTGRNTESPNNCPATQTVQVLVPISSLMIQPVSPICAGAGTQLQASGASSYTWSPSAGLSSPDQAITNAKPLATTVYTVTAGNSGNSCISQKTVAIIVNPLPVVDAGTDTTVNAGDVLILHGTGNAPVEFMNWGSTPGNTIAVSPYENTCYTLKGTSSAGCMAEDDVCVVVTHDWNVYIPNAFTPNSDHNNDVFIPVGYGISQIRLFVFNRWGTQIFAGNENTPGWDGKYKGEVCEQGVYVYKAEIKTTTNHTFTKVGHVTLLKSETK